MDYSVIIPVYNASKYIEKAVESALQFNFVNEVVLIEDGSEDESLSVCKKLQNNYARVKLYTHPENMNKGAGATRNLGIEKATSEFISFLDADDFFLPNRFDIEREIFKNNPNADGVYGAIGCHYYNLNKNKQTFYNQLTTINYSIPPEDVLKTITGLNKNAEGNFSLIGFTVKKSKILEHKITFNESLRLHQDTAFIYHMSLVLNLFSGSIKEPVSLRGVHDDNRITSNPINSPKFVLNKIKFWNAALKLFKKHPSNWRFKILAKSQLYYFKNQNKSKIKAFFSTKYLSLIFRFLKH